MKLTIKYTLDPVLVSGMLEPADYTENNQPELFIDGNPVPKALADIIVLGLNVASEQYIGMIDRLRTERVLEYV